MMLEQAFVGVLRILAQRLTARPVVWAITGSCGLALQGMPIAVNDIDLQTDAAGAYAIEETFSEYIRRKVIFSSAERIQSHFGALEIAGMKVEIMGAVQKRRDDGTWEQPADFGPYRHWVSIAGIELPVLDPAYEVEAYRKLGRAEKAEAIRRWFERGLAQSR